MFIIFGSKNTSKIIGSGSFHCPRCNVSRSYQLKQNRRYFSLFFIPVLPLEKLRDTLECSSCKIAYVPESVLFSIEYTPPITIVDSSERPLASFGKRIGSYLIDIAFLVFLNFPLATLIDPIKEYLPDSFVLVFLPVWALYFFLMEWLFKGTIGKKICRIEISADTDKGKVNVLQYFIRSIVKSIPVINIIMFFNDKRKGCHDYAANTIVVEKK